VEVDAAREAAAPHPAEPTATLADPPAVDAAPTSGMEEAAVVQEIAVVEPSGQGKPPAEESAKAPRFQIFVLDSGFNSPARKVLLENFAFLRELQKSDPIYVVSKEKSIEFLRSHPSGIGKGPVIVVHDLAALRGGGTRGFHGFRLHLGLMSTERQALLALQSFARFLATHRQSADLEAVIRRDLRREGIAGAIAIILDHEPREIGG
jgi:hypothetical protein